MAVGELKEAKENLAELEARAAELLAQRMERARELAALSVPLDAPPDDERRFDADASTKRAALADVIGRLDALRDDVQADILKARGEVQRVLNSRRLRWQALQEQRQRWEPLLPLAVDFAALAAAIEPVRRKARGYIPRDIDQHMMRLALWARNLEGMSAVLDKVEMDLRADGDEFADDDRFRVIGEPVGAPVFVPSSS
jgi:hypothetical protein